MNKIVHQETLANNIKKIEVQAPLVARKALPGQFVVLRVDENGERIPLTIAGTDPARGTITIIFQEVGTTTMKLGLLKEGESIANLAGPLGKPVEVDHFGQVCIVAGGVGAAFLYWMAQAFKARGNRLITILGARSQNLLVLEKELQSISDTFILTTDDGSKGEKGLVTTALARLLQQGEKIDYVLTAGPIPMMKQVAAVTRPYGIKTVASLNPIMVDGTGMCGGCRVTVGGKVKFACVDGPDFDAHQVDFEELARRNSLYHRHEEISRQRFHQCRLQSRT
ncbi:MAG TPA: sulfide/dihydroorotate dehydrogenase-like FAD/NAD-binding protein [bacterium]|nr:sulfide/dihydroorotate dehydrogenase-like FAD/NAD-binding protein [bacterium]HPP12687.1 sulfide/dihydroorotate dehydrogenase-like FAD/NAD-binding protein [bacterium]